MVSVQCSYTVIPSGSTPTTRLTMSHCDQIKLHTHGSQLYVYNSLRTTHDSSLTSAIHTLRTSLSKALFHCYPLAGRLCLIQGGRFQLLCNAKGAQLLEATCESSLDDDLIQQLVDQLVPNIDYGCPIEEMPLLVAQLTRFPCGGLTLGVSLCRAVVDGGAVVNFLNSWAKLARGESLGSSLLPQLDRTVLNSRNLHMEPRFDHPEFFPPPIWTGSLAHAKVEATVAILKLNKDQVQKLKKKASDSGNEGNPANSPYTSFEVISGHLWRCVCKVRYAGNGDQLTRLSTLVNCRHRLSSPLPHTFFGNATLPTVTPTCSFDDIIHKPLSYAVGNVRQAIQRMNDEYVRSALDYIADQKDMNLLRETLYGSAGSVGGQFRGNPNLYLVGWTNFPFYATDFGWGKPVYLRPGHLNSDGKAFVLNDTNGDGFIVAICLQTYHIDALKTLFYEDIEEVLPTSKM